MDLDEFWPDLDLGYWDWENIGLDTDPNQDRQKTNLIQIWIPIKNIIYKFVLIHLFNMRASVLHINMIMYLGFAGWSAS